jgi:hypothetical protein
MVLHRIIFFAVFVFAVFVLSSLLATDLRAARVDFQFTGTLNVPGTGTTSLFNTTVPKNSPIAGTFSYDVPTTPSASNPATFQQQILGGFTLDINNGAIRLSASDFLLKVTNDFQRAVPLETVDVVQVQYDTRFTPAPSPLIVNGANWSGSASIALELSWPSTTFPDSALTANGPLTPGFTTAANSIMSSNPPASLRPFSILSVSPVPEPNGAILAAVALLALRFWLWRPTS